RRIVVRRRIVPERLSPPATSTGSSILCAYSSEYQPDQAGHLPYVPAAPGTYFARTAYRTAATRHFAFHRCSLSEHPPSRSTPPWPSDHGRLGSVKPGGERCESVLVARSTVVHFLNLLEDLGQVVVFRRLHRRKFDV